MPRVTLRASWDLGDRLDDLAFSPDGTFLAGVSTSGSALVTSPNERGESQVWMAHPGGGLRLAWHPSAGVFATSGQDGTVSIWTSQGQNFGTRKLGRSWCHALRWNPSGTLLAVSCGKALHLLDHKLEPARSPVDFPSTIEDLAWQEAEFLFVACQKGLFQCGLRNIPDELTDNAAPLRLAMSPRYLAWCDANGEVLLHEHQTKKPLVFQGFDGKVGAISWSHNHRWIALGSLPCLTVWDCAGAGPSGRKPVRLWQHSATIRACAFSPIDDLLASAGDDRDIHLWNPSIGEDSLATHRASAPLECLVWSPNGQFLASGDTHGTLELFAVCRP